MSGSLDSGSEKRFPLDSVEKGNKLRLEIYQAARSINKMSITDPRILQSLIVLTTSSIELGRLVRNIQGDL